MVNDFNDTFGTGFNTRNNSFGIEFEINKMMGDSALAQGDMKTALDQTDICITLAANHNGIYAKQFHEVAYKGYVELAKKFYSNQNIQGAKYSLNNALMHQAELHNPIRPGLKHELVDYSKNKREDFPME